MSDRVDKLTVVEYEMQVLKIYNRAHTDHMLKYINDHLDEMIEIHLILDEAIKVKR